MEQKINTNRKVLNPSFKRSKPSGLDIIIQKKNLENQIFGPPLDIKNDGLMRQIRERNFSTKTDFLKDNGLDFENHNLSQNMIEEGDIFNKNQTQIPQLITTNSEVERQNKKNKAVCKKKVDTSGTISVNKNTERKHKKFSRLISELLKVEEEFDKHDIENSIPRGREIQSQEYMNFIKKEDKFYGDILSQINAKYETSELNSFKISLTKSKITGDMKVISTIYLLMKRLIDGIYGTK